MKTDRQRRREAYMRKERNKFKFNSLKAKEYFPVIRVFYARLYLSGLRIKDLEMRDYFINCQFLFSENDIQNMIQEALPMLEKYHPQYKEDEDYWNFKAGDWDCVFPIRFKGNTHQQQQFHEHLLQHSLRIWKDYLHVSDAEESPLFRRAEYVQDLFGLDQTETEILILLFLLNAGINDINTDMLKNMSDLEMLARFTGRSENNVKQTLRPDSNLLQSGLLEDMSGIKSVDFEMTIMQYLGGLIGSSQLMSRVITKDTQKALPLSKHLTDKEHTRILLSLLESGNIHQLLLYGVPGTGKTEYARSLIRSAGKTPVFLSMEGENKSDRWTALKAARQVIGKNEILVVDEADDLLNTRNFWGEYTDKGWINDYLDSSTITAVWITNHTNGMDDSLLRRFSYSVGFMEFSDQHRMQIWKNLLRSHPIKNYLDKKDLEKFCSEYPLNAGQIASALESMNSIPWSEEQDKETVVSTLKSFLSRHAELKGLNKKQSSELKNINARYNPRWLHTDQDIAKVTQMLLTMEEKRKNDPEGFYSSGLLLWGSPGTGKTEYAKYLAHRLEKKLIVKRASDLKSKWLGDSEKNIASAFQEAVKEKSILFLDEADSLFYDRENATRSFEVSQTNELLTQMENFNGILICATNLLNNLDPASLRRFHFKIGFQPPSRSSLLAIYKAFFVTNEIPLSTEDKIAIKELQGLTFGDVHAVSSRLQFLEQDISHQEIIHELSRELGYHRDQQKKVAGF